MISESNATRLAPDAGEVIVRMYRQGLGDCYLLAFGSDNSDDPVKYVLIDCGVHVRQVEGTKRLAAVMNDIVLCTGGHIHVLAVTHEHADHISGFTQKGSPFITDEITVDDVWLAWTEIPGDTQADALRKNKLNSTTLIEAALERMKEERDSLNQQNKPFAISENRKMNWRDRAISALNFKLEQIESHTEFDEFRHSIQTDSAEREIELSIAEDASFRSKTKELENRSQEPLLATSKNTRLSRNQLAMALISSKGNPVYCEPGDVLSLYEVSDLRVLVLGPPRNEKLLKKEKPSKVRGGGAHEYKETYFSQVSSSIAFSPALKLSGTTNIPQHLTNPFPKSVALDRENGRSGPQKRYQSNKNSWRRIDSEWLGDAEALALAMDSDTNNTSLVLAFEIGEPGSGDVLLFCGDAQVGNWLSWRDQEYGDKSAYCTADDLLARTLLYKVGHHGSHNATPKSDPRNNVDFPDGEPYGLELMTNIISMINVDKSAVSRKMPIVWRMPHLPLYESLREKSKFRVLRADDEMDPLNSSLQPDRVPESIDWEEVADLDNVKWRKSGESFDVEPKTALYFDVRIPMRR